MQLSKQMRNSDRKGHLRLSVVLVLAALIAMFVIASPSLKAQSSYGSIVGTVTDASGAAVAKATVTLTNTGTNDKKIAESDASGNYRFVSLQPANYKVEVSATGYKGYSRSPITVQVDSTVRVDTTLEVGAVTETVEVTTQAPLLQTDSGTMGSMVEGKTVQEMPLNGRNPMNLITLVPGVVPQGQSGGSASMNAGNHTQNKGWGNYQIGGGIAGQSTQYLDGVVLTVFSNAVALVPTQDVVQEFKVSTNAVSAEFGRFAGGVVEMTTKSGGNAFHGSGYEYLRNAAFNANNFFNKFYGNVRPQWDQNQYGAVLNGPIKKDKAFFLFSWEGFKSAIGIPTTTQVPSYNMMQGIFKGQIQDGSGNCAIAYNAVTNTSTIPSTCFDSTSKVLLGLFPVPSSSTPDATAPPKGTPLARNNSQQYNSRVDYNLGSKQRFFARYTYWNVKDSSLQPYGPTKIDSGSAFSSNLVNQAVLGDTVTFNPTTIMDLRLSYIRDIYGDTPPTKGIDETQFGAGYTAFTQQLSIHMVPIVHIFGDSLEPFFGPGVDDTDVYNTYNLAASVLKIKGNHTLKFGAELRSAQDAGVNTALDHSGAYFFFGFSGDAFADFLMGAYAQATYTNPKITTTFNNSQGYYATDTWQVNRKLTVNMGLRWELPGGISEKKDLDTIFLPNTKDPVTGYNGALVLVNSPTYNSRSVLPVKHNLFSPRLSFAYRLDSNTAVRGGYGLVYLPPDLNRNGYAPMSPINSAAATILAFPPNFMYHGLQNPFGILTGGTINHPVGRKSDFVKGFQGQVIQVPVQTTRYPYMQQWNLSISREMKGNWMAEIGYAGSKGTHLPAQSYMGINQLDKQYYSLGAGLNATTTWNGISMSKGQSLRPYPYFQDMQNSTPYTGSLTYHSMQARIQKRFENGGQVMAAYTWAKTIGDTDTQTFYTETASNNGQTPAFGGPQDFSNPRGDRSLMAFDTPHRLVISYVLNLPFGKGQKYASDVHGVADKLISGWAANGITSFQSGNPLGLTINGGNQLTQNFGGGTLRPNVVAGCTKTASGSRYQRVIDGLNSAQTPDAKGWFNAACFTDPGAYAFGNAPRNDSVLRSQGVDNFDFSVLKSTKIKEQVDAQFRVEFFNIFNHTQFAPPGTVRGSGTNYNVVVKQANQPRLIQLAFRVNF